MREKREKRRREGKGERDIGKDEKTKEGEWKIRK